MAESRILDGFDERLLATLLAEALSRGGDHADLFFEERRESAIALEDARIKTATAGSVCGIGVRVLSGERTGYAYTEQRTPEAVREAARTAATIASGGGYVAPVRLEAGSRRDLYRAQQALGDVAPKERVQLLQRADAAARAVDPRVVSVQVSLTEEVRELAIVSSTGVIVTDVQPMISFRVGCVAEEHDLRTNGTAGQGARRGRELLDGEVPEETARKAAEMAVRNLSAQAAPGGPQTVVLGPAYSGILLHEAVGHGLEADFNRKGLSRYSGQVGERVASPLVTVIDDGTMDSERGSINVDDEGVPSGRTVLIENGILKGYLHDRLSAQLMDVDVTGNGRRQGYDVPPMPRMTNTLMPGGPHTSEEIIGSVQRGVYAVSFGGGQVEIGKGDFVFAATEAYLIEDGKITAPLRDVTLIGNGPEVMSRVSMVADDYRTSEGVWTCGKDGQMVPVGVGMPTVRVDDLIVGGTA